MTMKRRVFGRTGLELSEVALGGGTVGGILVLPDEATRHVALDRAIKAGVDWIDTAPMYGKGVSEQTIGQYLPHLSPRPRVSTKFTLLPEDLDDIPGAIERSLEQSLRRLSLPRVELLQLHNHIAFAVRDRAITPDHVLKAGGVADTLDRLKKEGMIGATGLTAAGDITALTRVIDSGRFDCAQIYYNMINPSAAWQHAPPAWTAYDMSGLIDACKRHNMGMLNIRVYAGGSLASPERHGREYIMIPNADLEAEDRRAAMIWDALGGHHGTPAQAALRFALTNTDFACSVIGIANLAQLDEAIIAAAMGPLPPLAIDRLKELWGSNFGIMPGAR